MQSGLHRISSLGINISVNAFDIAVDLRQRVLDQWSGLLLPVFDTEFDTYAADGAWQHIDQLHLKIRLENVESFSSDFAEKVQAALLEQLPLVISKTGGSVLPNVDESNLQGNDTRHPEAFSWSMDQVLNHYLHYGALPWFIESELVDKKALTLEVLKQIPVLFDKLSRENEPVVWFRVVDLLLLSEDQLWQDKIVDHFSPPSTSPKELVLETLKIAASTKSLNDEQSRRWLFVGLPPVPRIQGVYSHRLQVI